MGDEQRALAERGDFYFACVQFCFTEPATASLERCTGRPTALEMRGLTKRYDDGTLALEGFDLIPAGAFFGLLGPNGAGKTTLISAVCNLIRVTAARCSCSASRPTAARAPWMGWPSRTSTSTAS